MQVSVCIRMSKCLALDNLPCFDESTTQEEDVAMLEFNVTFLGDLLDLLKRDCMATHSVHVVFQTLSLAVRDVIYENSSGSNTILSPVTYANTITFAIRNFVGSRAAVPSPRAIRHFRAEVAKPIPLRGSLRIETPDIVPSDPFIVWDGDNLMFARESVET